MERIVKTKFWEFNQNNSGGYYVTDKENGVSEFLIIEAKDATEALSKLYGIGDKVDGFFEYCGCCGERWRDWINDDDGHEYPTYLGEKLDEATAYSTTEVYLHYYDGTKKLFTLS